MVAKAGYKTATTVRKGRVNDKAIDLKTFPATPSSPLGVKTHLVLPEAWI
jgi:hypothetical protein